MLLQLLRRLVSIDLALRSSHCVRIYAGIAACNIGGVTIHSFAGIGIGMDPVNQLVSRIRKNKKAMSRWLRTKTLIIDEGRFSSYQQLLIIHTGFDNFQCPWSTETFLINSLRLAVNLERTRSRLAVFKWVSEPINADRHNSRMIMLGDSNRRFLPTTTGSKVVIGQIRV